MPGLPGDFFGCVGDSHLHQVGRRVLRCQVNTLAAWFVVERLKLHVEMDGVVSTTAWQSESGWRIERILNQPSMFARIDIDVVFRRPNRREREQRKAHAFEAKLDPRILDVDSPVRHGVVFTESDRHLNVHVLRVPTDGNLVPLHSEHGAALFFLVAPGHGGGFLRSHGKGVFGHFVHDAH